MDARPSILVVDDHKNIRDPLATFKTYKDSTFAMMREAARRGHELWACEAREMGWRQDQPVSTEARRIRLTGDEDAWFAVEEEARAEGHRAGADDVRERASGHAASEGMPRAGSADITPFCPGFPRRYGLATKEGDACAR